VLGPRRPNPVKTAPYECGLPSDVRRGFRFGISFYLVAMLFILFDVEAIFLYPVAVHLKSSGAFVLAETGIFVALLAVAFVFVWRRGALDWK
jgi:NADH-quinone oxidoreductase subunit A